MRIRTILAAFALLLAVPALPGVASNPAEAQTIAYAERGTTNLRAGPGTNFRIIGKVYGGAPVYVYGSQGGWYNVTVNGQWGWMAGSRLQFGYASAPVLVPQPLFVPRTYSYGYSYGPSSSFQFRDYDRDHSWHRRSDRRERSVRPQRRAGQEGTGGAAGRQGDDRVNPYVLWMQQR
jgi:uncharacterized protein YraI